GISATAAVFIAAGSRAPLVSALGAGLIALALGFRDNTRSVKRLPPALRLYLQAALAGLVWLVEFSGRMRGLSGAAVTVVLLVATANAFNLLDNMNGVAASGTVGTCAGAAGLALLAGSPYIAAPAAAVCAAALGFLRYNLVRPRLYLGAGGPEFIGFVLGATALELGLVLGGEKAAWIVLAILIVPALDATVTIGSRLLARRPPFKGGVDHLSHRLVALGVSTRKTALLHGLAAAVGSVSVAASFYYGGRLLPAVLGLFLMSAVALAIARPRSDATPTDTPPRRQRRLLAPIAATLLSLLLVSAFPAVAAARDLYAARTAFNTGAAAARSFDLQSAGQEFVRAGQLAARAERFLNSPLTLPARLVPLLRDNVTAARAMASGANLLAPAALEALGAAEAFPRDEGGPRLSLNAGRIDLTPWPIAEQRLLQAASAARFALTRVEAANGVLLPPLSAARDKMLEQGNIAYETLTKAGHAAGLIPHVFGAGQARTWFLAIQNPVELRATGGFLGAFGIIQAEGGRLKLERFDANDELPRVGAPPPASQEFIEHYDQFGSRTTWSNANMTPDFPTAAQLMARMWETGTGRRIDGVIAIDATGLNELLKVVGPVEVDPVGPISSSNFLSLALNEAYIRFPEKQERSVFLLEVGRQVWQRLLGGTFSDPRQLASVLGPTISGKHLQMWSPGQEERVRLLGISGELSRPAASDYLMVVGQNAAGNKIDYYARRSILYQVDLTRPSDIRGRVRIEVENNAPASGLPPYIIGPYIPDDPPGLNRTYTSVYVSPTTNLLSAQVDGNPVQVQSHAERGLAVFSHFLEILSKRRSVLELSLQSSLPVQGVYRLKVQRQPSLYPDQLEIDILLPEGAFVVDATDGMTQSGNRVTWRGGMESDREFYVAYRPFGSRLMGRDPRLASSSSLAQ
ncbi:MAG: DUF4012 domain-containing protein, partial [Actinomycetota bacterium]|nr:DUF4012 domain-containing protein [Actinomycetota bacterium]